MSSYTRRGFLLSLTVPFAMTACTHATESEKIAKQFIDAYYVRMSLPEAAKISEGLAGEKIAAQIQLLDGQSIQNRANVPTVDFYLVKNEASQSKDEAAYVFEVKPKVMDVGPRQVYVKMRLEGETWKVSQFKEEVQAPK